jgi:hypothetical protein
MTSDAQKNAGWLLPEQIDGYTEFVCYQISVPNVIEYRSAFLGALQELAKWWNWEKTYATGDTRASQAAAYWRELLAILGDCEGELFDIRQKPDAPCIIQKTFNNGGLWIDAINMQLCPPRVRVNNGIVQWFNPTTNEWEETDGGDERTDGDAPPPWPSPPVGQDGACLSAENITAVYQTTLTQIRADVALGKNVTAIASGILGTAAIFIPAALYGTIALALSAAALAITEAGLDAMLEQEHLDNFKCQVYLNAQSDGSITQAGFTALRAGMASWASGLELEFIEYYLDGYGSVGLQRQGRAGGITTGNCTACDGTPLTYLAGAGPAFLRESGDTITITMTSTIDPSHFEVDVVLPLGVCANFEVVAIRNFVSQIPAYGPFDGACQPCGSNAWTDSFVFSGLTTYFNKNGFGINSMDSTCEVDLRITLV